MEPQFPSYPLEIYFLAAFIGLILIIYRPKWAFLFSTFCLSARNFHMAVFTRPPFFGEILNLNDLLLWITVLAMFKVVLQGQKIWVPNILLAIMGVLLLGVSGSLPIWVHSGSAAAHLGSLGFPHNVFCLCQYGAEQPGRPPFLLGPLLGISGCVATTSFFRARPSLRR